MGLEVVLSDLGEDLCGYYDHATETVHINSRLSLMERRCTLVHELIHWERGDDPTDNLGAYMAREVEVDHETARRLVSLPQLMWVITYFGPGGAGAGSLGVCASIYISRIMAMTRLEQIIFDVCAMQCIGVRTELAFSAGCSPALLNLPFVVDERILDAVECVDAA